MGSVGAEGQLYALIYVVLHRGLECLWTLVPAVGDESAGANALWMLSFGGVKSYTQRGAIHSVQYLAWCHN